MKNLFILPVILAIIFFLFRRKKFRKPVILINTIKNIIKEKNIITGNLSLTIQNNNDFSINITSIFLNGYYKDYRIIDVDKKEKISVKPYSEKEIIVPVNINLTSGIISFLKSLTDKKMEIMFTGYLTINNFKINIKDSITI